MVGGIMKKVKGTWPKSDEILNSHLFGLGPAVWYPHHIAKYPKLII